MHPTQTLPGNGATPTTRRLDGKPETETDRRFFDLRESGYTGPIDSDGDPVADLTIPPTRVTAAVADSVTPAVTLRAAALYLDRHGWCQGSYYEQTATAFTPAACTVGAIGMVCYGGPVDAPAQHFDDPGWADFEEAVTVLDLYLGERHDSDVYSFNDAKGRTAEQVTTALRAAADHYDRTSDGEPVRQRCACGCGCDADAARYCHGQGEQPGRRCLHCLTHHPIAGTISGGGA